MKYLLVISLFLSFSAHRTAAQCKQKSLDSLYTKMYKQGRFNGNVLFADQGKIVFEKSYGLANSISKRKLNVNTVFELASVSKQFTAMGIVLLHQQGKLSYEDKISSYIPELSFYGDITIKQLLIHTSGLPDYMEVMAEKWSKSKIATNLDVIHVFAKYEPKVLFKPDEKWEYSNTGYLLLATIIERVSQQSFAAYLQQYLFKPLGMKHTFIYRRRFQPEKMTNYADGYVYADQLNKYILPDEIGKESYYVYLDGVVGDGMVNSNLHDLLLWDRALYTEKLVSAKDKELIFSSFSINNGKQTDYGFGWSVDQSKVYGKMVSHSGCWAGYLTYIERDLDHDKTIIILQNYDSDKIEIPVKNARKILYGLKPEFKTVLDTLTLKSFAGTYKIGSGSTKELIFEQGKLYIRMDINASPELVPLSDKRFVVDGLSPEVIIEFIKDKQGKPKGYHSEQIDTGIVYDAKKME